MCTTSIVIRDGIETLTRPRWLPHSGPVRRDEAVDGFYAALGRRIRASRDGAGFTQDQLAGRVGVTRSSVANTETGRQKIPVHVLVAIADALRIDPCALLPIRDDLERTDDVDDRTLDQYAEPERQWIKRVLGAE
jgi:transcriptional regulator with XRE-family HTH domain